jgi:hypothetical protein
MTAYYQRLFSIDCRHAFYTDANCHDLLVEPTEECSQLLRRHRLLFKPQDTGGIVITEQRNVGTEAAPVLEPVIAIAPDTTFTFQLRLRNPDFLNITNVNQSLIKPFSAFIFTNAPGAAESSDGIVRSIEVHNGALGNPMAVFGKVFRYAIAPSLNPVTVAVENAAGQRLFQVNLTSATSELTLDLNGFSEDIYQIRSFNELGTEVSSQQVLISDAYTVPQLFGFLLVRYSNDILSDIEDQHAFILSLENRQIRWIYRIDVQEIEPGHPNNLDPNNLQIQNVPVAFTRSVVNTPPRSVTFTSDAAIALQQQPYTKIELRNGAATKPLIANLPNPEPRHLVKDSSANLRAEMRLTIK